MYIQSAVQMGPRSSVMRIEGDGLSGSAGCWKVRRPLSVASP